MNPADFLNHVQNIAASLVRMGSLPKPLAIESAGKLTAWITWDLTSELPKKLLVEFTARRRLRVSGCIPMPLLPYITTQKGPFHTAERLLAGCVSLPARTACDEIARTVSSEVLPVYLSSLQLLTNSYQQAIDIHTVKAAAIERAGDIFAPAPVNFQSEVTPAGKLISGFTIETPAAQVIATLGRDKAFQLLLKTDSASTFAALCRKIRPAIVKG